MGKCIFMLIRVSRKAVRPSAEGVGSYYITKIPPRARVGRFVMVRDDIRAFNGFTDLRVGSCFGPLWTKDGIKQTPLNGQIRIQRSDPRP